MKPAVLALLAVICLSLSTPGDFSRLYRLEGVWKTNTGIEQIIESWTKINSTELHSKSFKLAGQDSLLLEEVRLVNKSDGIFYIPIVKGQNGDQEVAFKLISTVNDRFTFENKQHDFPQRIIYHFINADSLVARIEGETNGRTKGINYYYKKMK